MVTLLLVLRNQEGITVETIWCDNAGENKNLKQQCINHHLPTRIEFTAPYTPQQNGVVEQLFATLYGRVRAMLNTARLQQNMREGLWCECANTATMLHNILVNHSNDPCPYFKMFNRMPPYHNRLRTFGELGIANNGADRMGHVTKIKNKGKYVIFCGYSMQHSGNVYQLLQLQTKKIILS